MSVQSRLMNCREVSAWDHGYLEKQSEGLAGVLLRNVDKEFPQQSRQSSGQVAGCGVWK